MTNSIENPDRLLTCIEAAKYLNISKLSMDRLRLDGYIPYVKIGKRKIRYKESDLKRIPKNLELWSAISFALTQEPP